MKQKLHLHVALAFCAFLNITAASQEPSRWKYTPEALRPFWLGDIVESESVLFVRETASEAAHGFVLFPIHEVVAMKSSAGDITYEAGVDYSVQAGSREIVIPVGSRIVTSKPAALRRPAGSQKHQLTHRDGQGEILFGAGLEYHHMQTSVTYRTHNKQWPVAMPSFDAAALPLTLKKLRNREDVSIVLLGDSISTGCNATAWGNGAPYQPAYQDLLVEHLKIQSQADIELTNLSVSGMATPWGITMVEAAAQHHPDLVILAFGMNDSAGISAVDYGQNIATIIKDLRSTLPTTEFILVASMLGNRDWPRLNHDVFPQYRNELSSLCKPGIATADMTSVWDEMLRRKKDCDLTGNGVNHPNDFGHRVYAQVLSTILTEPTLLSP